MTEFATRARRGTCPYQSMVPGWHHTWGSRHLVIDDGSRRTCHSALPSRCRYSSMRRRDGSLREDRPWTAPPAASYEPPRPESAPSTPRQPSRYARQSNPWEWDDVQLGHSYTTTSGSAFISPRMLGQDPPKRGPTRMGNTPQWHRSISQVGEVLGCGPIPTQPTPSPRRHSFQSSPRTNKVKDKAVATAVAQALDGTGQQRLFHSHGKHDDGRPSRPASAPASNSRRVTHESVQALNAQIETERQLARQARVQLESEMRWMPVNVL